MICIITTSCIVDLTPTRSMCELTAASPARVARCTTSPRWWSIRDSASATWPSMWLCWSWRNLWCWHHRHVTAWRHENGSHWLADLFRPIALRYCRGGDLPRCVTLLVLYCVSVIMVDKLVKPKSTGGMYLVGSKGCFPLSAHQIEHRTNDI